MPWPRLPRFAKKPQENHRARPKATPPRIGVLKGRVMLDEVTLRTNIVDWTVPKRSQYNSILKKSSKKMIWRVLMKTIIRKRRKALKKTLSKWKRCKINSPSRCSKCRTCSYQSLRNSNRKIKCSLTKQWRRVDIAVPKRKLETSQPKAAVHWIQYQPK